MAAPSKGSVAAIVTLSLASLSQSNSGAVKNASYNAMENLAEYRSALSAAPSPLTLNASYKVNNPINVQFGQAIASDHAVFDARLIPEGKDILNLNYPA